MKRGEDRFQLQFDPSDIDSLEKRYLNPDAVALDAGRSIASGNYSRENLKTIFSWKTNGRGISRLKPNSDPEIAEALGSAVRPSDEKSAVEALCKLHGVDVPVAYAILMAINPERYTVVDVRALQSLGVKRSVTVDSYLAYLNECRRLANEHGVSLRTLDRALWQWSKEQSSQKDP